MPKQREKMTEVHSCGSPPFSTCLGAVASFIISQGQKCHKKPFPLVYYQSHKEKSVKGGHRPQRLPLILFFVGYNAGGENGCPSVSLLPIRFFCFLLVYFFGCFGLVFWVLWLTYSKLYDLILLNFLNMRCKNGKKRQDNIYRQRSMG